MPKITIILLLSIISPIALSAEHSPPIVIKWKLIRELPHDSQAFTQGLECSDKTHFLESIGQYGKSEIRFVDRNSGIVKSKAPLAANFFGEGVTKFGPYQYQLTWQEGVILKWDFREKPGFRLIKTIPWEGEGWGITHDQKNLWVSNGSDELLSVNPKNLKIEKHVKVTLAGQPLTKINELEMIDDKIFANVWMTSTIARINLKNGVVDGLMDISSLVPKGLSPEAVANGIAWDALRKKLYVTGKFWPKLFELEFEK